LQDGSVMSRTKREEISAVTKIETIARRLEISSELLHFGVKRGKIRDNRDAPDLLAVRGKAAVKRKCLCSKEPLRCPPDRQLKSLPPHAGTRKVVPWVS